jgi:enamine deaminase RidA (YjgF/YER057c/UK114 family)
VTQKEVTQTNLAAAPVGPYAQAIRYGDIVYVAGKKASALRQARSSMGESRPRHVRH